MFKLFRYFKNYKKQAILGPLFKLLEAIFDLIVPLVMASVIDKGIRLHDKQYIYLMIIVLFLLAIVGLVSSLLAQYEAAVCATGFATELRYDLFKHIQMLEFKKLDQIGNSTLITRMTNDINVVQNGINIGLRLLLRSPFIVFGALILAFFVDSTLAWLMVGVIFVLTIVVFIILLVCIPLYKKVQESLDQLLKKVSENLQGVRVIRAFYKEKEEINEFKKLVDFNVKLQIFVGNISTFLNPITYLIINCGILALIYYGANQINLGYIGQGKIIALISYMSLILIELIKLANLIINLTKTMACGNRIQEVFEQENSMIDGDLLVDSQNEIAVEFNNVSIKYDGNEEALSNLNFKVYKNQKVGIIGATGSGKSTLVNLILRFYDASSGQVSVFGRNVKEYKHSDLKDKIAIVMQKNVLFKGTIKDNLLWGNSKASDKELLEVLNKAQILDFVSNNKDGLKYKIEQDGRNLSGGQRQRLCIARALIKKAPILIFDDSTSALDLNTESKVKQVINSLDNVTTFIVSQRISSIKEADLILVLDDGKLVGQGNHTYLLENCDVYKEIYHFQYNERR